MSSLNFIYYYYIWCEFQIYFRFMILGFAFYQSFFILPLLFIYKNDRLWTFEKYFIPTHQKKVFLFIITIIIVIPIITRGREHVIKFHHIFMTRYFILPSQQQFSWTLYEIMLSTIYYERKVMSCLKEGILWVIFYFYLIFKKIVSVTYFQRKIKNCYIK